MDGLGFNHRGRTVRIFCTVGSQLPFDRLTKTVAEFAKTHSGIEAFFQIGPRAEYAPYGMSYRTLLDEKEFEEQVQRCQLIVGHAGMGTIITALTSGRPVLVMPRRGCFHETRNDHQVDSAFKFRQMGLAYVAMNEQELLVELEKSASFGAAPTIGPSASEKLVQSVQTFIDQNGVVG